MRQKTRVIDWYEDRYLLSVSFSQPHIPAHLHLISDIISQFVLPITSTVFAQKPAPYPRSPSPTTYHFLLLFLPTTLARHCFGPFRIVCLYCRRFVCAVRLRTLTNCTCERMQVLYWKGAALLRKTNKKLVGSGCSLMEIIDHEVMRHPKRNHSLTSSIGVDLRS